MSEILHGLCNKRQADRALHANEQEVVQVQDMAIRGLNRIRVFHLVSHHHQYAHFDDEGKCLFSV